MKKSGSGGLGYTGILECRVQVCQVLKKVGFGWVISGLAIPGPITNRYPTLQINLIAFCTLVELSKNSLLLAYEL